MKNTIFLISGKRRSGKDEIAKILNELLGGTVRRYFYANALKKYCSQKFLELNDILPEDIQLIDDHFFEDKSNPLGRKLLQIEGAAKRDEDPDYWVHKLQHDIYDNEVFLKTVGKKQDRTRHIAITDCRYNNEIYGMSQFVLEKLPEYQVKTIRVHNPAIKRNSKLDLHPSETMLDLFPSWDLYILNNFNPEWGEEDKKQARLRLTEKLKQFIEEN